jgi:sugar (pentulose or hexulose) kinase
MSAFVVLDAGTGGGKCAIFDTTGRLLAARHEPWTYEVRANPELPFVKEFSFSAPHFWNLLSSCVRHALVAAGVHAAEVVGVAATSQREGCVFLDAQGTEIYAGPNLDGRGFAEALEVLGILGDRLYQITGHSAPFIFPLVRYLWFRKHATATVAHLLMINDWITYRLCGELSAEPSNATESMLFDVRQRCWSDEILSTFDIPRTILPPLLQAGQLVGRLTPRAAADIGLLAGTPVLMGGADTQCSLLGAGMIESGATAATLGTTAPLQTVLEDIVLDAERVLWAGCHVVPDRWVLESNIGDTGDAYLWLLDLVSGGRPRGEVYALGDELARDALGAPTMMYIGPAVFNLGKLRPSQPGAILFPYPGMHLRPSRATLVRAFHESIGYAVRANLEQLAAATGAAAAEVTLSGGMTRSPVLTQAITDIVGVPVHVTEEPESAALGCAILMAASAGGVDLTTAARSMSRHRTLDPDPARHEAYRLPYAKWREIYARLEETDLS